MAEKWSSPAAPQPEDAPPAYQPRNEDDEAEMLDRLVEASGGNREVASHDVDLEDVEVRRVKRFVQHVLCIDYRATFYVGLSRADIRHFTKLSTALQDLGPARKKPLPTPEERRAIASYFWHHLHEPCRALSIPTEYVVLLLARSVKYRRGGLAYMGCFCNLLRDEGISSLATKLYFDKQVIIPKVYEGRYRDELVRKLGGLGERYFHYIHGIGGPPTQTTYKDLPGHSLQAVFYKETDQAIAYEKAW